MSRLSQSSAISGRSQKSRTPALMGIVLDVITNEEHESIIDLGVGKNDTRNTYEIGFAKLRRLDDNVTPIEQLRFYEPHDYANLELPIVGESVEIIKRGNGQLVYRRITSSTLNTGNYIEDVNSTMNPDKEKASDGGSGDYSTTSQTGTPNSSGGSSDEPENEYFESTQVNALQFYEGDKVIQSRFGQSIRFSGYNNVDNVLAPTIVIRNRQGNKSLDELKIGTPLYLGILTDTGSFRFNSVNPRTHEVLAKILRAGVEHHLIHEKLNDNNTESRLRLQGYAMSEKLEILYDYNVAVISLSKEELAKYNYKKGDTDSLANLVLSIKGMKAAIVFTERDGIMKISFRSKGAENPVNLLAKEHFNGGGHANASGGMSDLSVMETLEKLKGLIPKYF